MWATLCCVSAIPVALAASQEISVPNFDRDSAACVVGVPDSQQCTAEGCNLLISKSQSAQVSFSCLPKSAPTGFENPAPEVKVQSLRAQNARAHLSVLDDLQAPPADRMREFNFCVYGKQNNLCGNLTMRRADDARNTAIKPLKSLVQSLEIKDPLP
jgi:hypothetical protein